MFKSLFSKLMASYLAIILITLLAVGVAASQLFANYYYSAKEKELARKGQEIADLLTGYMNNGYDRKSLDFMLNTLDQFLNARMVLVDREGLTVVGSDGFAGPRNLRLEDEKIEKVLQGQIVSTRGLSPHFNQAMLTVAVPLKLNNQTTGALLLFSPVNDMTATVSSVRRLIFWAACAAVILAALLGYLLSRSISRPLHRMSEVTLAMAQGNFKQRVGLTSKDEVGQLAEHFNRLAVNLDQTVSDLCREKGKVENILANMVEGVIAVDGEGIVILVNHQAEKNLWVDGRDILNLPVTQIPCCSELAGLFTSVLKAGEQRTLEFTPGSKNIFLLAHVAPLQDEGGNNYGAVGVLQDITEQRKLEQLRRDFVANVSHELRTPLTSIQGFSQAIIEGLYKNDAARNRYIHFIHQETLRLSRLVDDLLDLATLEAGLNRWKMNTINVPELISQVLFKLKPQIDQQRLTVEKEIPGTLPAIPGNRDRIEQVLTNILANAIQFSPSGGQVKIRAQTDGAFITVSIHDGGAGIPPEDLPYIWDRFHRVEKSRNRATGGTGLGLAIVKQIVEAHNGSVAVESNQGLGSIFSITLPMISE